MGFLFRKEDERWDYTAGEGGGKSNDYCDMGENQLAKLPDAQDHAMRAELRAKQTG
jgi:hypothetical protein